MDEENRVMEIVDRYWPEIREIYGSLGEYPVGKHVAHF